MVGVKARLDDLCRFAEKCRGKQLIFLYRTPDGTEKYGGIDDLISDNGAFIRVLSGNRLDDLDELLAYERGQIHEPEH